MLPLVRLCHALGDALRPALNIAAWPELGRWPRQCAHCAALFRPARPGLAGDDLTVPQHLCPDCCTALLPGTPRCRRCALPGSGRACCQPGEFPWHLALAGADHEAPWAQWVWAIKFSHSSASLRALGPLVDAMEQAVQRSPHHDAATWPDALLPAPQSPARWRERGHSQSLLLARMLGRRLQRPVLTQEVLRRSVAGASAAHQIGLTRRERWDNMQQGFTAVSLQAQRLIQGRHIALIDDVMTTGATAAAASQHLLAAGAASVQVWVATRTPAPQ
ncbi:ComF family protein [Amphibiibacter pelophylacis]|uniref:Uncharacterized protein n=1 Tax=Amphibiibacter pelophylacis TaxID=1799477 RepID=A0ACC6P0B1_9BURK